MTHKTYEECKRAAQQLADAQGFDVGIECMRVPGRPDLDEWMHRTLPSRPNRQGHELRCEVVHPTNIHTTKPGHGPNAPAPKTRSYR